MIPLLHFTKPGRLADGAGNVRALAWNEVRIQHFQRLPEGIVIQGQRTQGKGTAGKRDEPHAVALQPVHKILDAHAGAFQAVRREVFRQHTAGGIHGE